MTEAVRAYAHAVENEQVSRRWVANPDPDGEYLSHAWGLFVHRSKHGLLLGIPSQNNTDQKKAYASDVPELLSHLSRVLSDAGHERVAAVYASGTELNEAEVVDDHTMAPGALPELKHSGWPPWLLILVPDVGDPDGLASEIRPNPPASESLPPGWASIEDARTESWATPQDREDLSWAAALGLNFVTYRNDDLWTSGPIAAIASLGEVTGPFQDQISDLATLLRLRKNVILEGVPGTGKTHAVRGIPDLDLSDPAAEPRWEPEVTAPWQSQFRKALEMGEADWDIRKLVMVFHPSTTYEDFVEGMRPNEDGSRLDGGKGDEAIGVSPPPFVVRSGIFRRSIDWLNGGERRALILVLDEINRANVPRVLGDLLGALEPTKRAGSGAEALQVTLPYSKQALTVPEHLYVVGTMNTTDRSVAPLDAALRRRFAFLRVEPESPAALTEALPEISSDIEVWAKTNRELEELLGPDAKLGHSYLFDMKGMFDDTDDLDLCRRLVWRYQILPQLFESLAANGATPLLGDDVGRWMTNHGKDPKSPPPFKTLRRHLKDLELAVILEGTGLGQLPVTIDGTDPRYGRAVAALAVEPGSDSSSQQAASDGETEPSTDTVDEIGAEEGGA